MIVALLWALGGSTPFFHIIYAIVPGTKFFRAPSTIIYLVGLAIAVFAALGRRARARAASSRADFSSGGESRAVLFAIARRERRTHVDGDDARDPRDVGASGR